MQFYLVSRDGQLDWDHFWIFLIEGDGFRKNPICVVLKWKQKTYFRKAVFIPLGLLFSILPTTWAGLDIRKESLPSTPVQEGDIISYVITVTNNDSFAHFDVNLNEFIPSDVDFIPDTAFVSGWKLIREYVADDFNTGTFSGNSGTALFLSDWDETGENDGPTDGHVQVIEDARTWEGKALRIGASDQNIGGDGVIRAVNLHDTLDAELRFQYKRAIGTSANNGEVLLRVSIDNGGTWTQLDTFPINQTHTPRFARFDLTPFQSPNTLIQFIGSGIAGLESYFYADQLGVYYTKPEQVINELGGATIDSIGDFFEGPGYNENDGTKNWNGPWIETGDDNTPNGGQIKITPDGELRFRELNGGVSIKRSMNLYTATNAVLKVDWRALDLEEELRLEVSDPSGIWHTLEDITGTNHIAYASYDITPYTGSNTYIRFRNDGPTWTAPDDIVWLDRVWVEYNTFFNSAPGGTPFPVASHYFLPPNESMEVTLDVLVKDPLPPSSSEIINTATVVSAQAPIPLFATSTNLIRLADLLLTTPTTVLNADCGEDIALDLYISNDGPHSAQGIEVTLPIPAGLTFESFTSDAGIYDPSNGVWTISQLNPGETIGLHVIAQIDQQNACQAQIPLTAAIQTSDTPDPNPSNNSVSWLVLITDNTEPELLGTPPDITTECTSGNVLPSVPTVTAEDNCFGTVAVIFSETNLGGNCPQQVLRTWTANDNCGNVAVHNQLITIQDTQPPTH